MRWHEMTCDQQKRRLATRAKVEAVMRLMGDPARQTRPEQLLTLADLALEEEAVVHEDRLARVASHVEEVRAAVERTGIWNHTWEWRISTSRTDRIERLDGGFRSSAESNASWRADFATFAEAYEAVHVFSRLDQSLFYALGWTAGKAPRSSEPDETRPVSEAYLKRLASEPASGADDATEVTVERVPRPRTWRTDAPAMVLAVRVARETLVIECLCVTARRADEFAGVFASVARDLVDVLEWEPLPG